MTPQEAEPLRRPLLVFTWVAAANADASDYQRSLLKEATAVLGDHSYSPAEAYEKVVRDTAYIMGPEWSPQGEWGDWIKSLLENR